MKKVYQVYITSPKSRCKMWLLFPSAELRKQFCKIYSHLEPHSGRKPIKPTPWDLDNTRISLISEGFNDFVVIWDDYISNM